MAWFQPVAQYQAAAQPDEVNLEHGIPAFVILFDDRDFHSQETTLAGFAVQ